MSLKAKYESVNWSKVDPDVKAQVEEIKKDTKDFSDEGAMDVFKDNFNALMELVPKDAMKGAEKKPEPPKAPEKKAAPKKPTPSATPKPKVAPVPKPKPKPKAKVKSKSTGKDVEEMTAAECLEQWRARRSAAKKSAKKSKTTPVFDKISDKVEAAIESAIKNTSADDIKKNPGKFIEKVEKISDAGKKFLQEFRSILGDDYDTDEIKSFEKGLDDLIAKLKKKYEK